MITYFIPLQEKYKTKAHYVATVDPNQELVVYTVEHVHFFPDFLIPPPATERKQNRIDCDNRKTIILHRKISGGFVSYLKVLFQKPWLSTAPLLSDRLSVSVCRPCPPVEMSEGD